MTLHMYLVTRAPPPVPADAPAPGSPFTNFASMMSISLTLPATIPSTVSRTLVIPRSLAIVLPVPAATTASATPARSPSHPGRLMRPVTTSLSVPSPPTLTTVSPARSARPRQISEAWPARSVAKSSTDISGASFSSRTRSFSAARCPRLRPDAGL